MFVWLRGALREAGNINAVNGGKLKSMRQQVQTSLPAEQVLDEAASFMARRRAKIGERTATGLRFGLPGSDEEGRVTVEQVGDAGSTVTVEAEGLTVLAIAEAYVRELRKQTRDASRQARTTQAGAMQGFAGLRQQLGMAEPAPTESPIPNAAAGPGALSPDATAPDGPAPLEAPVVTPNEGPKSVPPPDDAAVPAPHPTFTGPEESVAAAADEPAPAVEALASQQPSAEAIGGVPEPEEVEVRSSPAMPNPGTLAGGAAGSASPDELGPEASEAPGAAERQGGTTAT